METLTKNRDVDDIILHKLDDRSLLNLCIASPQLKFCNDEKFWRDRFYFKFGKYEKIKGTWKKFYLGAIYYWDLADEENQIDNAMGLAAKDGHMDLVEFFISLGANNWRMGEIAARKGKHSDIEDFFRSKIRYGEIPIGRYFGRYYGFELDIDEYYIFGPKTKDRNEIKKTSFSDID